MNDQERARGGGGGGYRLRPGGVALFGLCLGQSYLVKYNIFTDMSISFLIQVQ
jgi:hypothetical protein